VPEEAGLWPLTLAQAVSLPSVILLAVSLRAPWLPRARRTWWALAAGPLGASATLAFMLSAQYGYLTVAGILTSLYPAATVVLAALVLHEKVHRAQGVGLGLCAVAIAFVAGG
jgi:drug/metabolite transporter (DMT)-like permease